MRYNYYLNLLALFFTLQFFGQTTNQEINAVWEAVFKNDRKQALTLAQDLSEDNAMHMITKEMVKNENGLFSTDEKFASRFKQQEDFEYFLYAFWSSHFLFQDYLSSGFNNTNLKSIYEFDAKEINEPLTKEALVYLQSVAYRYKNEWDKYNSLNASIPAIREWQFCGAFENLNGSGLSTAYAPESSVSSTTGYDANSNGTVNWYNNTNFKSESYQFIGNHTEYGSSINYAQTFIESPVEQRVTIRIGASAAFKAWLNDVEIIEKEDNYTNDIDAHVVAVTIPQGSSRFLLKLSDVASTPYFIVRVTDENGKAVTNITTSAKPRTYKKSSKNVVNPTEQSHPIEEYFAKKIAANPDNYFNKIALVRTYLRNSKYIEAKPIVGDLLREFPESSFLRGLMILCYNLESDTNSANELEKNIVKDDKEYYMSYVYRLQETNKLFKMSMEEFEEFVDGFRKATDYDMITITADLFMAVRKNDKEEIEQFMDDLTSNHIDHFSILKTFVTFYSSFLSKPEKEQNFYENHLKKHFDYSTLKTLARIYDEKGQQPKVLKLFENLYANLNYDNNYLLDYASYLSKYKKYDKAIELYNRALENYPYSFTTMQKLGDIYYQLDNKEKALAYFKNCLQHNGGYSAVRKKVEDIQKNGGQLKKLQIEDVYAFIEEKRVDETPNNYGYNYLLDEMLVQLYEQGGGTSMNRYIIKVTSKNGIESLKEFNLGLSGGYSIIKSEIVKEDNSIKPASRSGSNLVFNDLEVGDVINIEYSTNWSNSGRFFRDYVDYFQVDSYHPTLEQRVVVMAPKSHSFDYRVVNGEVPLVEKTEGDYKIYEWKFTNEKPLPTYEDYMPGISEVGRYVHVGSIKSWNDIALWYSDLVRPQMKYNDEVDKVFKQIFTKPLSSYTDNQKAELIYNYIAENLSYSFVTFKQSGYVPQKPSKTIKTKLGDCKDLSTLFVVLADKANLDSHLVLVLTSDYGKQAMILPNQDFNHCIVKVFIDGKEQYLELTDNTMPFKALPPSLEYATFLDIPNHRVQQVKEGIYITENPDRILSTNSSNVRIYLGDDTVQPMEVETIMGGSISSAYRRVFKENQGEVVNKQLEEDFQSRINADVSLDSIYKVTSDYLNPEFRFTSKLKLNEKLEEFGNTKIFKVPFIANPYDSDLIKYEKRAYPIEYVLYENADSYKTVIDVIPGNGETFVEVPKDVAMSFKDHSYSIQYKILSNGNLQIISEAKTPKRRIEVEEYPEFRKYVKSFLDARKRMVGFKRING